MSLTRNYGDKRGASICSEIAHHNPTWREQTTTSAATRHPHRRKESSYRAAFWVRVSDLAASPPARLSKSDFSFKIMKRNPNKNIESDASNAPAVSVRCAFTRMALT